MKEIKANKCIAMVPCPGLSHLIPLVEFAKLLNEHHPELFQIKFLIPTLGTPTDSMKSILNSLPQNMDYTILPQVNMEELPKNIHLAVQMKLTVKHSLPSLHEQLKSLKHSSHINLVSVVFDMMSSEAVDVSKQLNIPTYLFTSSGAIPLSFSFYLPKLNESVSTELIIETTESINVPGVDTPFQVKDLPDPYLYERSSETFKYFLRMCQRLCLVDGIIINSFSDLESGAIRGMQERNKEGKGPRVYSVGPLIQRESRSRENESECIQWLHKQPPKSVLYVSFGSGGTLSHEQLNELAFGLEMSGHRFLWVVRAPADVSSSAYFVGQKDNPLNYLPSGFLERSKERGLVVPSWAPQVEILRHGSTGGFLTHCGWSSTLEGVVHGVPMIAWPLFAEQRMNAATLTHVLKVAVRPKPDDETRIIKPDEICTAILRIMEGDESLQFRQRIQYYSTCASAALTQHGSSKEALSSLVLDWDNNNNNINNNNNHHTNAKQL